MFFSFDFVDRFDGMRGLFYIVSYFFKYSTLKGQKPYGLLHCSSGCHTQPHIIALPSRFGVDTRLWNV